jgi:di/tricarboxylate transporter
MLCNCSRGHGRQDHEFFISLFGHAPLGPTEMSAQSGPLSQNPALFAPHSIHPCSWLIAIAFWLAGGFIKSGLGNRIAYGIVKLFGKTTLGLTYSLVLAEGLLAPAIPSVAARAGGIFFPLAKALCLACGSDPENGTEKVMGSYVMKVRSSCPDPPSTPSMPCHLEPQDLGIGNVHAMDMLEDHAIIVLPANSSAIGLRPSLRVFASLQVCFQATCISSAMFITAMAANPLAVNLAAETIGETISWGTWALAGIVPGAFCLLTMPLLMYILYPPEKKDTPNAPIEAQKQLDQLGPMSTDEKLTAMAFAVTVGLWIGGTAIGVNAVAAALVGLTILLVTGVVTWKQCLSNNGAWDTLTWFAALIAMASHLNKFGFIPWFSEQVWRSSLLLLAAHSHPFNGACLARFIFFKHHHQWMPSVSESYAHHALAAKVSNQQVFFDEVSAESPEC